MNNYIDHVSSRAQEGFEQIKRAQILGKSGINLDMVSIFSLSKMLCWQLVDQIGSRSACLPECLLLPECQRQIGSVAYLCMTHFKYYGRAKQREVKFDVALTTETKKNSADLLKWFREHL